MVSLPSPPPTLPAVAADHGVVAAAAEDRVVARRRVDDAVAGADRGGPEHRVGPVAADEEVVVVGADQGPEVVVDDVVLLAADRPAGAGRPGLGEPDEDAAGAVDDAQSALADRDVGEGVGAAAAAEVVAAAPGDERVVAGAAVDGRDVREAAAADDRVVAVVSVHRCRCRRRAACRRRRAPLIVSRLSVSGGLGIDVGRARRRRAGDRVRPGVAGQGVVAVAAGEALDVGGDRVVLARLSVAGGRRGARRQRRGDRDGPGDAGGGDPDVGHAVGAAVAAEGVVLRPPTRVSSPVPPLIVPAGPLASVRITPVSLPSPEVLDDGGDRG